MKTRKRHDKHTRHTRHIKHTKHKRHKKAGTKSKISMMIASGGQGCIYHEIPCKGKQRNTDSALISKISFHPTSCQREFKMDQKIRTIKNYGDWALVWDVYCQSPPYKTLKQYMDIDICLAKRTLHVKDTDTFHMLTGKHGGDTYHAKCVTLLTKNAFATHSSFADAIMKALSPLQFIFVGVGELHAHKLVHGDMSVRNVVVQDTHSRLIDFGLANEFSKREEIERRMSFLLEHTDKIYDAYPYDYLYCRGASHKDKLSDELRGMPLDIYRDYHEDYIRVHECILGRRDVNHTLMTYMKHILDGDVKPSTSKVIHALDSYSLGIMLPTMIHDMAKKHKISWSHVKSLCSHKDLKPVFDLLREMTEFLSETRLLAHHAYPRFCEICEI